MGSRGRWNLVTLGNPNKYCYQSGYSFFLFFWNNPISEPMADMSAWEVLGVPKEVQRGLSEQGFTSPTPIQTLSLPPAISHHRDIIGAAETVSWIRNLQVDIHLFSLTSWVLDFLREKHFEDMWHFLATWSQIASQLPKMYLSNMKMYNVLFRSIVQNCTMA